MPEFEYLVKSGKCPICHRKGPLHRHHPDYSKSKETITICASCHMKIHQCLKGTQRTGSNPYVNPLVKQEYLNAVKRASKNSLSARVHAAA